MGITFSGTFFGQKYGKNSAASKKNRLFGKSTKRVFTVLKVYLYVVNFSQKKIIFYKNVIFLFGFEEKSFKNKKKINFTYQSNFLHLQQKFLKDIDEYDETFSSKKL